MAKKKKKDKQGAGREPDGGGLALDPEARVSPKFDSVSVAKFPVADRKRMGVRVVDNCAEEHQM